MSREGLHWRVDLHCILWSWELDFGPLGLLPCRYSCLGLYILEHHTRPRMEDQSAHLSSSGTQVDSAIETSRRPFRSSIRMLRFEKFQRETAVGCGQL